MSQNAPIAELKSIHLELESDAGKVKILKGIDLQIPAGKTVSIVGPSGSGKTTLLMILGGLERPTEGTVHIAERDITKLSEDDMAAFRRDKIGIIFQNFHLIPTMTALENVAIPLEFAGEKKAFEKAEAALKAVGLSHRLKHYPGQLSGGEQQRVAIARAFVAEPDVILADEPTGNLDGDNGKAVMKLLFDLTRKNGMSLILVTHDITLADSCDMTIHLKDGAIAA